MHPHLPFSVGEILWTLTFAAQLVLLVVLLGRERVRRFPWFTASIVTVALHLLLTRVLNDKLPRLTLASIVLPLDTIGAVIGLGVLVELARQGLLAAPSAGCGSPEPSSCWPWAEWSCATGVFGRH